MDDLILTGSDGRFLSRVVNDLATQFYVKDLVSLSYFLDIEVFECHVHASYRVGPEQVL